MAAHSPTTRPGLAASSHARLPLLEFRCSGCGYGARCAVAPDRCPMCSGASWDSVTGSALHEWDTLAPLARDR
jgi:hypothetical protein